LTANLVSQAQAKSGWRRGLSQNDLTNARHSHGGRAARGSGGSGVVSAKGSAHTTTTTTAIST
jgi:hypothetical protein